MSCPPDLEQVKKGQGYVQSMLGALSFITPAGSSTGYDILSIGLGAATLPLLLHDLMPQSRQTVVELSGDVVQASRCFGATTAGFDVQEAEGRHFLDAAQEGSYDAILIDAFDGDDKVPSCLTTGNFFQMAHSKLKGGGVLVMNAHSGVTLHNDLQDLIPAAQHNFPRVLVGEAPTLANKILVATTAGVSQSKAPLATGTFAQWLEAAKFYQPPTAGEPRTDDGVGCHLGRS